MHYGKRVAGSASNGRRSMLAPAGTKRRRARGERGERGERDDEARTGRRARAGKGWGGPDEGLEDARRLQFIPRTLGCVKP